MCSWAIGAEDSELELTKGAISCFRLMTLHLRYTLLVRPTYHVRHHVSSGPMSPTVLRSEVPRCSGDMRPLPRKLNGRDLPSVSLIGWPFQVQL